MWLFIVLVLFFVVNCFVANVFGDIAQEKGHEKNKYFWYCFWLTLPGYLMVVALPDRKMSVSGGTSASQEPAQPQIPDVSRDELPVL